RLRAVPRLRPARTGSHRAAAHPAPGALQRLDRTALGRPGLPHQLPLVRRTRPLAGPGADAARADRGHAATAAAGLSRPGHAACPMFFRLDEAIRTAARART